MLHGRSQYKSGRALRLKCDAIAAFFKDCQFAADYGLGRSQPAFMHRDPRYRVTRRRLVRPALAVFEPNVELGHVAGSR